MKTRIKRITPLQLGKMLAVLYGVSAIVLMPFMVIAALKAPQRQGPGVLIAVLMPILYIVLGFVFGMIGAFVYNLCAKWLGGVEVEVEEIAGLG